MTWPPERGVSKLPRLGSHPSQLAAYRSYAAAFSAAEHERYAAFYTDDVRLELGSTRCSPANESTCAFSCTTRCVTD